MIGTVLSFAAALLLAALAGYVTARQRTASTDALSGMLVLLAGIEVADLLAVRTSGDPAVFFQAGLVFESLLPAALLALGFTYFRQPTSPFTAGRLLLTVAADLFPASLLLFPVTDFFHAPDLPSERVLFLGEIGYCFYLGVMLFCAIALMNVEVAFAATTGRDRWRIKFEAIGVIGILAVLIFYYSQGLLYRMINMDLIPVRSSVLATAALLVGYSKFFRGNNVRVVVSRHLFYRSVTLFVVGAYFISLGSIGEGMRYFGGPLDRDIPIFLAFAGGMGILVLLSSERVRRRAKVYINKHFYAHKHDYREEWLTFTKKLASCRTVGEVQEAILDAYRETFGLDRASLYLLDRRAGKYVLAAGRGPAEGPGEISSSTGLIAYFAERGRVFNPRTKEYVPSEEENAFLLRSGGGAVVPLSCNNCAVEGLVTFGRQIVRDEFNYEDYDLMTVLARQSALALINMRLSEELGEIREAATAARIASFVIHDLKNLASSLSLVMENAEDHMGDPAFQQDLRRTIGNTLEKMKNLIQRLKVSPAKGLSVRECTDVHRLSLETVEEIRKAHPGARIENSGESVTCAVDGEEIKKVVLNIVQNALEAVGKEGVVRVETGMNGGHAYIRVSDNGQGMTEEFLRHHLCKPFRTTKEKGLGIGLYQSKQIIESHGGKLDVESEAGKGSVFTVSLPLAESGGRLRIMKPAVMM